MENAMNSLQELFDSNAQSDLDADLATAGQVLQKIAEEQGVDLDNLPDADVADLLTTLLHGETSGGETTTPAEPQKEASAMTIPDKLTYADVAAELAKVAAANDIDINEVSREEYHEAYNKLAVAMTTPEYAEEKAKQAAAEEQLMWADGVGRVMARGYVDELNKLAAEHEGKETAAEEKKEEKKKEEEEKKEAAGLDPSLARRVVGAIKRAPGKADVQVQRLGEKLIDVASRAPGGLKRGVGYGAAGTAALGTAAAAKGIHGAVTKDKKSADEIESEAMDVARQVLVDNDINPDTGEKLSEDPVAVRAAEILKEAGWL